LANVPKEHLTLTFILKRYKAQVEHREKLLAMFERVVIILPVILSIDRFAKVMKLADDLWVILSHRHRDAVFDNGFDLVLDVRHEDRMICRKITARFLNYRRMWDVFIITNGFDHIDHVVSKLARVVIGRRLERRS